MSGFVSHIKEAIALNKERETYYASQTNGASASLSKILILLERFVIPIAYYFDWQARKFNNEGILIVKNDFVSMKVKPMESPPIYTSSISSKLYYTEQKKVNSFLSELNSTKALKQILVIALDFYKAVKKSEIENKVHFAMLLHMLESISLIARNGIGYEAQSNGKSKSLSLQLIKIHKIAIRNALRVDRKANHFHQEKVGIILNDLPTIQIP